MARSSSNRNSAPPRELGLADARRPEEEKASYGAIRIAKPRTGAAHRIRDGFDGGGLLPDDSLLPAPLPCWQELVHLALHQSWSPECRSTWRRWTR